MKKIITNLIYLLAIVVPCDCKSEHQKDDHFNLRSVGYVQKRNYLIRRLEEPVKTLNTVQKQLHEKGFFKTASQIPIDQSSSKLFQHPSIQEVTQAIIAEQSIEPFYRVWGDFLSYRYLQNNSFVRETIMLLLLLYKKMLLQLLVDQTDESTRMMIIIDGCLSKNEQSISDMVAQTDVITRATKKAVIRYYPELTSLLSASHHIPTELCEGIDCDDVHDNLSALVYLLDEDESNDTKYEMLIINSNMRFYHIQRLLRPIFLLS
ncbi:MAG TPA: hypothetical protein VFF04_04275, partial [Candidatus Babeliales bacterium]|nr:hypothetical protein [Candidatus Babeliales bacterium]